MSFISSSTFYLAFWQIRNCKSPGGQVAFPMGALLSSPELSQGSETGAQLTDMWAIEPPVGRDQRQIWLDCVQSDYVPVSNWQIKATWVILLYFFAKRSPNFSWTKWTKWPILGKMGQADPWLDGTNVENTKWWQDGDILGVLHPLEPPACASYMEGCCLWPEGTFGEGGSKLWTSLGNAWVWSGVHHFYSRTCKVDYYPNWHSKVQI